MNHEMKLSEMGENAKRCWESIPKHFPHVRTPLFVVMPNHIHGILVISDPHLDKHLVANNRTHNDFGPQTLNLASVIRGFKAGVTTFARKRGISFAWQPRYHDHIIRNLKDLNRIADYIENNVGRWDMDKYNV